MASKYDDLSATAALEQTVAGDLAAGFEPRGATVVHNGSATMSAPGGRADIEVRDGPNKRLILVEVTRRTGSAADGEFIAIADHLDRAVDGAEFDSFGCLFVSPATSARMRPTSKSAIGSASRTASQAASSPSTSPGSNSFSRHTARRIPQRSPLPRIYRSTRLVNLHG
jgi:hypothetical protein